MTSNMPNVRHVFELMRHFRSEENEARIKYLEFCYPGIAWEGVRLNFPKGGNTCSIKAWSWDREYDLQYKDEGQGWKLIYSSSKRFWLKKKRCHAGVVPGLIDRKGSAQKEYNIRVAMYNVPLVTLFEGLQVTAPDGSIFVKDYIYGRWALRSPDGLKFFNLLPVPEYYKNFLEAVDSATWPDQQEVAKLEYRLATEEGRC